MTRALVAGAAAWLCCVGAAMAQPANDTCAGAEAILITSGSSGSVSGNSSTATDDAGLPACTLSTSAASGTDGVWYSFVGTGNRVTFDSCGTATDFTMRVFCGDCNVLFCAASDDDGCDGTNSLAPRMSMCTTLGTTYYLLYSRFGTGAGAAYTLNWSDSGVPCSGGRPQCTGMAAANDECVNAVALTIGGPSVIGTTIDATAESSVPPACNSVTPSNAVWYSFVGDGTTVTVDLCNANAGSNTKLNLYTGGCGSLTCAPGVSGNSAASPVCSLRNDVPQTVTVCTTPGQTYYIAVSNDANGAGLFEILLTSSICVPPPANDNCAGALPITPNGPTVTGNTSQATNESPAPPTCSGFSTFNLGVWYTFTASNNNRYIASTCNAGTDFNTRVYVYSGACGAFTCVAANATASPACGVRSDAATASFCASAGTQYFILVTNDTTGFGNFELSLTDTGADCTPPVNDNCSGALPITPGTNILATNVNASNETPAPPTCTSLSTFNLGMWYTFTPANNNRYTISTCNPGTIFNTRLYVYTGACGAFTCVAANATASPACDIRSDAATVSFCGVAGTQYFFLVTNDTTGSGDFELSLTDTGADCSPPVNDNCSGALPIAVGTPVTGTNVNATNETPAPGTCNGLSTYNLGMWYTFTEGATARRLSASTCSGLTNYNTRVYVYTGACGAFTCVNANATATPACGARSDAADAIFCTTPGAQYWILVTNDTTGTGTFELLLSDTGIGCAPPANDLCANATVVSTIPFNSNVAADTATGDIDNTCNAAANVESRFGVWYQFTPSEPGNISFVEGGAGDVVFTIFTGADCNSLAEVFCNTNETGTVSFALTPGTNYYILCSLSSATALPPANYVITINYAISPGACCNGSNCTITAGSAACTSGGGTFQGYGTNCGGLPLPENTNNSPVSIPDYAGTVNTVTSVVNVTDPSIVNDVNVFVDANHTFVGDLNLRLRGPNNVVVPLLVRPVLTICTPGAIADGDDFIGLYVFDDDAAQTAWAAAQINTAAIPPGSYIPSDCGGTPTSLDAAFAGISAAGAWTLEVSDEDEAIVGTINSFAVVINNNGSASPCATSGACCRGSTCVIESADNCTGFANAYSGNNTVCNVFGANNTSPCCLADYNHVGGITVQDIFDYLGGYFSADPKADINGGGTSVQDIFDYLSAYFTGGC